MNLIIKHNCGIDRFVGNEIRLMYNFSVTLCNDMTSFNMTI